MKKVLNKILLIILLAFSTPVISQIDTIRFSLRDEGPSFQERDFTKSLINLHLNTEHQQLKKEDPLYKMGEKFSKRIGFPMEALLNAWTGNVSFRQGGIQEIDEHYIESELDEDFNITEVVKSKKVKVTGFSLYLSMNSKGRSFVNRLFDKGILTKDGDKYRLLYSPPLNMSVSDTSLALYTSRFVPKLANDSLNQIIWTNKSTPFSFQIDSISLKNVYGSITIPLQKIIKDNINKRLW